VGEPDAPGATAGSPTGGVPDARTSALARDEARFNPATAEYLRMVHGFSEASAYKAATDDALRAADGDHILDLGCGTGEDALRLAGQVGAGGRVTGVDVDARVIAEAGERLAQAEPSLRDRVTFLAADATRLPFPDGHFAAARIDRVLQHVEDPVAALREVRRAVRPGGRVVCAEPEWATVALQLGAEADPEHERVLAATLAYFYRHLCHPHAGLQLAAFLRVAGWREVRLHPLPLLSTSWPKFDQGLSLGPGARAAAGMSQGALDMERVEAWIQALDQADRDGTFAGFICLIMAIGTVPAAD
jgi:ubiquinone/menaquinone biosynthesis C-methylase UbiE